MRNALPPKLPPLPERSLFDSMLKLHFTPTGRTKDNFLGTAAHNIIRPGHVMGLEHTIPSRREIKPIPYLAERRRRQYMLFPRLLFRIIEWKPSDESIDIMSIKEDLTDAMNEPIAGLGFKKAKQLSESMNRRQQEVWKDFFKGMDNEKAGAVLWYALCYLLDEGWFTVTEGSALADGILKMRPIFDKVFEIPLRDASAQAQGIKFIRYLRKHGEFVPPPGWEPVSGTRP